MFAGIKARVPQAPAGTRPLLWILAGLISFLRQGQALWGIIAVLIGILNFVMIFEIRSGILLADVLHTSTLIAYGLLFVMLPVFLVILGFSYRPVARLEQVFTTKALAPISHETWQNTHQILEELRKMNGGTDEDRP